MKYKKMMVAVLCMVLGGVALSACTSTEQAAQEVSEMMQQDEKVTDGSEKNIVELNKPHILEKKYGKYINFWIKNTGNKDIAITIDGKAERIISPGEQGHTYIETGFFAKEYIFKAVPSSVGGRISLDYRIAQRDNQ